MVNVILEMTRIAVEAADKAGLEQTTGNQMQIRTTQSNIKKRLGNLEEKYYPRPILILAQDSNGDQKVVTVRQLIDENLEFVDFISGGERVDGDNLKGEEVKLLVDYMHFYSGIYEPERLLTNEFKQKGAEILSNNPNAERKRDLELLEKGLERYEIYDFE